MLSFGFGVVGAKFSHEQKFHRATEYGAFVVVVIAHENNDSGEHCFLVGVKDDLIGPIVNHPSKRECDGYDMSLNRFLITTGVNVNIGLDEQYERALDRLLTDLNTIYDRFSTRRAYFKTVAGLPEYFDKAFAIAASGYYGDRRRWAAVAKSWGLKERIFRTLSFGISSTLIAPVRFHRLSKFLRDEELPDWPV